jgi:hypothetical protein
MLTVKVAMAMASALVLVTSCAARVSSTAETRAHTPRKIILRAGHPDFGGVFTVDLHDCTMVLERGDYMPRSGRLDAHECTSLSEAARPLPLTLPARDCPVAKIILSSFSVTYDDGTSISGPRCTSSPDGDPHERVLFASVIRVAKQYGSALETSGSTPPGECDPIECRPKTTSTSSYEFSDDGAFEPCPDGRVGRKLEDRCMRDDAGTCSLRRIEVIPCPR